MSYMKNSGQPIMKPELDYQLKRLTPTETEKSTTILSAAQLWKLQRNVYLYCKKHHQTLIFLAKFLRDRIANEGDNHVTVEGGTGSGKSHFTIVLMFLVSHLNKTLFDLDKQMLFIPSQKELEEKWKAVPHKQVLCLDEAMRALHKHDWYNKEQQALNLHVKTERRKLNTVLYNIQSFHELTKTFRDSNIHARILIIRKYGYTVRLPDESHDEPDKWHMSDNIKIMRSYTNKHGIFLPPKERLALEKRAIGVQFYGKYPDFKLIPDGDKFWEYYCLSRDNSRNLLKEKEEQKKEEPKLKSERKYKRECVKYFKYIKGKTGWTIPKIIRETGGSEVSTQTWHRFLKE